MTRAKLTVLAMASALAALCAQPSWAAETKAPAFQVPAQESQDEAIVRQAVQLANTQGPAVLKPRLDDLRRVASHAPARYPLVEVQGPWTIVRDPEMESPRTLALLLGAAADKRSTTVVESYNTYGMARLLLASYAVETNQPQEALRELDAATAMQPDNGYLVSEKAAALEQLRRPADALVAVQGWLAANELAGTYQRAILLRAKGYALVELGRFDDAEIAYQDSLELDPDHKGAQSELVYIRGLKRGGVRTEPVFTTSDKAAAGVEPAKK